MPETLVVLKLSPTIDTFLGTTIPPIGFAVASAGSLGVSLFSTYVPLLTKIVVPAVEPAFAASKTAKEASAALIVENEVESVLPSLVSLPDLETYKTFCTSSAAPTSLREIAPSAS